MKRIYNMNMISRIMLGYKEPDRLTVNLCLSCRDGLFNLDSKVFHDFEKRLQFGLLNIVLMKLHYMLY